jgi:hypothetical protein
MAGPIDLQQVQPMDAGMINPFKSYYRQRFALLAVWRDDVGMPNVYNVNQLEAMQLAAAAWETVSPETISNWWRHTNIMPSEPFVPPAPLPPASDSLVELSHWTAKLRFIADEMHPHVREMMCILYQDPPTEEELTDEQLLL